MKIDYHLRGDGRANVTAWWRGQDGKRHRKMFIDFEPCFWVQASNLPGRPVDKLSYPDSDPLAKQMVWKPTDVTAERKRHDQHYLAKRKFRRKFLTERGHELDWDEGPRHRLFVDTEAIIYQGQYTIIAFTVYDSHTRQYETHLVQRCSEDLRAEVDKRFSNVHWHRDFFQVLVAFTKIVGRYDSDQIIGWNVHWDVIVPVRNFARRLGMDDMMRDLSPEGIVTYLWGRGKEKASIQGREVFDLCAGFQFLCEMRTQPETSYSLGYLLKKYFNIIKPNHYGKFEYLLENDPVELVRYNRMVDVKGMILMDEKFRIMNTFEEMAREFQCELTDCFGASNLIDYGMLRMLLEEGRVPLSRASRPEEPSPPGPTNMEPTPGIHEGAVTIDYKGMYVASIRSFNMDPETILFPGEPRPAGVKCVEIGNGYAFRLEPRGLMPRFLDHVMELRGKYESLRDAELAKPKAEQDSEALWVYITRRWIYKTVGNATYGQTLWAQGRWYSPEVGECILYLARKLLGIPIKELVDEFHKPIVYGHTDSCTIVLGWAGLPAFRKERDQVIRWINDRVDIRIREIGLDIHEFEITLDREYRRLLLTSGHNRYWGESPTGEVISRGFVKRNFSTFAAWFTNEMIKQSIRRGAQVHEFVFEQLERLLADKVPLAELTFAHALRQPSYKRRNPYEEAWEYSRGKYDFYMPRVETFRTVPVKAGIKFKDDKDLSMVAYPIMGSPPDDLDVNWEKVVELNILNRIEAIYPVVGLDFKVRRKEIIAYVRESLERKRLSQADMSKWTV